VSHPSAPQLCPTRRPLAALASLIAVAALGIPARAQVVNPADKQRPPSLDQELQEAGRLRSWEMPATVVRGEPGQVLREEDLIGPYKQPRWTATRLFPTTRVYVRPPGQFGAEYWTRVKTPRDGPSTVETQYEVEVGLPGRLQLDLYLVHEKTGSEGEIDVAEQKYEVRYALADWGKIWGNPTLYFEWVERSESPDGLEAKLLLGGGIAEGWHWGSNLVYEHEVSGERESEYSITGGVSHTLSDEKLALGGEIKAGATDTKEDRGDFTNFFEIGPSLQYRPVPAMHIDVAPLIGIGDDSRRYDIFIVLGWEF
jgi:hypothetical protein